MTFTYFLGLGSNLGDRLQQIISALAALAADTEPIAISSIYETEPVGGPEQADYLNLVCALKAEKKPLEMLQFAKAIELDMGRETGERWGPRPIDIDILTAGLLRLDTPELEIPHPRLGERLFVCLPLAELQSEFKPPGMAMTVSQLAARLKDSAAVNVWRSREDFLQDLPEGVWAGNP